MGYRSDVTIVMYPKRGKDYPMLKLFVEENLPDKFEEHEEERSSAKPAPCGSSGKLTYLLLEFDSIKWYEGYEDVDVYTRTFSMWEEWFKDKDDPDAPLFHYEFMRIGEDMEDIVYDCSSDAEHILGVDRNAYINT